MILIIDNYDSFTFNLVQYVGSINPDLLTIRNDQMTLKEIDQLNPSHILISPGPGRPESSGITIDVIKTFYNRIPILGVCLGHQAIGVAFGGQVLHCHEIVHGKTDSINHNGTDLFKNIPSNFIATRYHSLIVDPISLPETLRITATNEHDLIMGVKHVNYPVYGVQFHPESIETEFGMQIIQNFIGNAHEIDN